MFTDKLLIVSGSMTNAGVVTGQTLTGTDTTVVSENTIDLLEAKDIGEGEDLFMRVTVTVAQTGGTSVEYQAISSTAAALNANIVVLGTTGAIAVASLTAAARFVARVNPRLASTGARYLGARAVTVGAVAAGAALIDFGIDIGGDGKKFYTSGFSIA